MKVLILGVVFGLLAGLLIGQAKAETGLASYYGGKHHGRPTASGGRFNQWGGTCAHRKPMPFGAVLMVTTRAGRSVECTVTDRGPFIRGRIIDLSVAHARSLGMIGAGVLMVTVERIR